MKRWISLLVLLLLLTGCGQEGMTDTDIPQTPTEPEYTQQRLLSAELPEGTFSSVAAMGSNLLLVEEEGLVLLSGQTLEVLKSTSFENATAADCDLLQVRSNGLVYYNRVTRMLYFIGSSLQRVSCMQLQEKALGTVQLTSNEDKLYYCTAEGIRVLDLGTGITRTLTSRAGKWLGITQLMFDESLLCCSLQEEDGTVITCFISAQNGKTVREVEGIENMQSVGELYFCGLQTDDQSEWIYGWQNKQPRNFTPKTNAALTPLLEGKVVVAVEHIKAGSILYCYNLINGRRTSAVKLSGVSDVTAMTWTDEGICFLGDEEIFVWDISQTPTADKSVYMNYRYTEDDPNRLGLLDRLQQANALGQTYGVNILLWGNAEEAAPKGFEFVVDHVPENYDAALKELERLLSQFPAGFFEKTGQWTPCGKLNIVLVQQINTPSEDVYSTLDGMQYLLGGDSYIALAMSDSMEQSFYHAMGHVVDTVVMSNSNALYEWSKLNPSSFRYDNDYIANLGRTDTKYLEGQKRYFINTFAMSFPAEDRATILEYACMPGNADYFSSAPMQKKLQTICGGIREVFGLTGESYLWEQYLQTED